MEFYKRNSHPAAQEVLKDPFYWQLADDYAPIGTETAADALSIFWSWRDKNRWAPTLCFTTDEFLRWGYSEGQLCQVLEGNWEDRLESSSHHLAANVFDELVISIAYGQFIKEGFVDKDLMEQALKATERQLHSEVLNYRSVLPEEAKEAFTKTKEGLEAMPTEDISLVKSFKYFGHSIWGFLRNKFRSE